MDWSWVILLGLVAVAIFWWRFRPKPATANLSVLPERFVVFDLETTGLDASKHEIIEFGAIRVNRDSTTHETYQSLVKPDKKLPKRITELTGITQQMLETEGQALEKTLREFSDFVGDLPLVSFNAEFDMAFIEAAAQRHSIAVRNNVSCALKMARRAWPGRSSYRLADLARDGNLKTSGAHRALADAERVLIVYAAAATKLRSPR